MPSPAPTRRRHWQATLIVTLFFMAVAGAAAVGWWYARESPPHQGPIVLLWVDGLQGTLVSRTPEPGEPASAVEALAADGIVFDRAYAHAIQLLPATASVLSGQLPFSHHVRHDAGFTMGSDVRTMAELLRSRGFATGAAVSSFLLRRDSGIGQGFTYFNDDRPGTDARSIAVVRSGVETWTAAERWTRQQDGHRYFLFLEVPAADTESVVARLMAFLRDRGLYERSTIILAGARGTTDDTMWPDEALLHVPLVIKQPSLEGAGRHVTAPVQQVDVLPTVLDLVRAPRPDGLQGRSLQRTIDSDTAPTPTPIYAESLSAYYRFGGRPIYLAIGDRRVFVREFDDHLLPLAAGQGPAVEPTGRVDDEHSLRTAMDRFVGARTPDAPTPLTPATRDVFASLGYLDGLLPAPASGIAGRTQQSAMTRRHRDAALRVGARQIPGGVRVLESLLSQDATLAMVHYQAGTLLARLGRTADAVDAFGRARELRPDAAAPLLASAEVLRTAGEFDQAEAVLSQMPGAAVGDARTDQARAHEIAARIALARHDGEAATREAAAAESLDPGRPVTALVRGRLLAADGDYAQAVAAFREGVRVLDERGTTLEDLRLWLGDALVHVDQSPDAEAAFRGEIEDYPHNVSAYTSLTLLYRTAAREDEAAQVLEALVDAVPTPAGYAAAARLWSDTTQPSIAARRRPVSVNREAAPAPPVVRR